MSAACLYVATDALGFVGAFSSLADAKALVAEFPETPLLVCKYRAEQRSAEQVWAIPYQGGGLATVTDSEPRARALHRQLVRVGQAFEDDVNYWKHPVGQVQLLAKQRLDARKARRATCAEGKGDPETKAVDLGFRLLESDELHCFDGGAGGAPAPLPETPDLASRAPDPPAPLPETPDLASRAPDPPGGAPPSCGADPPPRPAAEHGGAFTAFVEEWERSQAGAGVSPAPGAPSGCARCLEAVARFPGVNGCPEHHVPVKGP